MDEIHVHFDLTVVLRMAVLITTFTMAHSDCDLWDVRQGFAKFHAQNSRLSPISSYPNGIQITKPWVVAQAATLGKPTKNNAYPERIESILNANRACS
jgi:hypothetical protein